MDDVFPPNVVVFSPQKAPDHEDNSGRSSVGIVGHHQRQIRSSSSSGRSSPLRSVEPDSTVQPGHSEATRDIIRALTDKIRRNKSKRQNADSVVSTTSSPDRPPQSPPVGRSGPDPSPGPPVDAHRCSSSANLPPKSKDNGASVQHSVATGPSDQQRLHSDNASSTDKTTTASSRNGSQLQLTSYTTSHSSEGICENRSKGNDEPNESKDKVSNILQMSCCPTPSGQWSQS